MIESVMPNARSAPTCGSISCNGICSTRTSVDRKAKQIIIASTSVIDILTMVQRKSSRCSRNGFDVSISGSSRNLKMSRSAMESTITRKSFRSQSAGVERKKTARRQSRPHAQRVRVTNLVLRDHAPNFLHTKCAAIENRFRFIAHVASTRLDWSRQKKVAMFVSKPRRRKVMTERDELAVFGQFIARLFAQFA